MQITTNYDREIKKGYVFENGYLVFEHDFNSGKCDHDLEMTEDEKQANFELVDQARIDDEYFVSMED